jgi:predicted O-methyltransferase YrrM
MSFSTTPTVSPRVTIDDSCNEGMNYHDLAFIIGYYNILKLNVGAEIGVLNGDTSHFLLRAFPELTLLSIDPYLPYDEVADERSLERMKLYERTAMQRLEEFGNRSVMFKATSLDVAVELAPGVIDFAFIDAIHSYEATRDDMNAWFPKVRSGGLLAGHDFRWTGVGKAVEEFCETHNLKAKVTPESSDVWYIFKP